MGRAQRVQRVRCLQWAYGDEAEQDETNGVRGEMSSSIMQLLPERSEVRDRKLAKFSGSQTVMGVCSLQTRDERETGRILLKRAHSFRDPLSYMWLKAQKDGA